MAPLRMNPKEPEQPANKTKKAQPPPSQTPPAKTSASASTGRTRPTRARKQPAPVEKEQVTPVKAKKQTPVRKAVRRQRPTTDPTERTSSSSIYNSTGRSPLERLSPIVSTEVQPSSVPELAPRSRPRRPQAQSQPTQPAPPPKAPRSRTEAAAWTERYSFAITAGQPWAAAFGLLASWTAVIVALWAAYFGLFAGALVGLGAIAANSVTSQLFHAGAAEAVGGLGILSGALVGAGGSFTAIYSTVLFGNASAVLVSIAAGFVVSLVIMVIAGFFESDFLTILRRYRQLSRREVERIAPLLSDVCDRLNIPGRPKLAMADLRVPSAWCHPNHLVLTTALLDSLDNQELSAVLAHELWHWDRGHAAALQFVSACSWPITVLYNFASLIGGQRLATSPEQRMRMNFGQLVVWFLFWPTWLLTRLVIAPAAAARSRKYEYEADAAAASIGYGQAMASALVKLSAFEGGRTGFEAAITDNHPPTELRIDRLQPRPFDDDDYLDYPLGRLTTGRLKAAGLFGLAAVVAIVTSGAILNHVRTSSETISSYSGTPTGAEQAATKFTTQFFNDVPDVSAAQSLVSHNVTANAQGSSMSDFQTLASDFNAVTQQGYSLSTSIQHVGCSVSTVNSSGSPATQVIIHEHWILHIAGQPDSISDLTANMQLQWTINGWQVTYFASQPYDSATTTTTFTSCP